MAVRILVVEDNRTNLDLMLYLLRAFGYEPVGISDGLAGLKMALDEPYDLLLVDILMPGIDGYEFARRLRAIPESANAVLVAVTALAMVGDRERVLAAGFDGYIAKPIDPQTFLAQVEAYLPSALRSAGHGSHQGSTPALPQASADGPVILAVDDVQLNLDVVQGTLAPFGYRVVEAHDANEGFARASEIAPKLILCDLHMPNGDGFEFIQRIKADPQLKSVPFIFLSSTAWKSSDRLRGMDLGAAKFILRPIDPQQLLDEVESLLGRLDVEGSRR